MSTISLLALIGAILACCLVVTWWVNYGLRVRWREIPRRVGEFAGYAAQGGVLEIRHERSRRTLSFAQISDTSSVHRLEFAFPDVPWSAAFFDELVSRIESVGLACTVEMAPAATTYVRRWASFQCNGTMEELTEWAAVLLEIVGSFLDAKPDDYAKIRARGGIRASAIEDLKARAR